jgi:hypothetical protein
VTAIGEVSSQDTSPPAEPANLPPHLWALARYAVVNGWTVNIRPLPGDLLVLFDRAGSDALTVRWSVRTPFGRAPRWRLAECRVEPRRYALETHQAYARLTDVRYAIAAPARRAGADR